MSEDQQPANTASSTAGISHGVRPISETEWHVIRFETTPDGTIETILGTHPTEAEAMEHLMAIVAGG